VKARQTKLTLKLRDASVICLIGLDGTGKTSHAFQLIEAFKKQGKKCKYVWFGTPYLLSFPFMVFFRKLGYTKVIKVKNNTLYSEHQYYRSKPISFIWPWLQFIDLSIFVLLNVWLPIKFGYTVICDRFINDNLVSTMVDVDDELLWQKLSGRVTLNLKPKNTFGFLLDIEETVAFQRKDDIPDISYLKVRRQKYLALANQSKFKIVNASLSFNAVQKDLNSY
jgi:thymidylate kinase